MSSSPPLQPNQEVQPLKHWPEATCFHSFITTIFTIFFLFFSADKETTPFSSEEEGSTTKEGYNLYQEEGQSFEEACAIICCQWY
jgi:hypothetical protein